LPIDVTTVLVDAGSDIYGKDVSKISRLSGVTNASFYYWTPSIGLADSSLLNTLVFPDVSTTYYLTATENGCSAYDEMRYFINNEIVIPNTFSPNGDGQNDKFEILYVDQYTNNVLQIFDRWGQMVYETTAYSYEKAWDGKNKKNEYAEGVYYYHLELRDQNKRIYNGSITIIK
jgi:gliding motility-associated-like protein